MSTTLGNASKLLKLVDAIAVSSYRTVELLPESEKWDIQAKLQREAVEAVACTSEGCGVLDPRDALWQLGKARGHLASIQGLTKLAHATDGAKLDPEVMVQINQAIDIIDVEAQTLPAKAKAWMETAYLSTKEVK